MTGPLTTLRDSSIVINDEYKPCDSDIDCLSLIFNEAAFFNSGHDFEGKNYDSSQTLDYTNITDLRSKIEDLEFVVEQHLIAYCNSSNASFEVSEVLALNETSFEDFLKEKLRADYSEIGYFFLEVFATLIALSWGLISTIIYYAESATENISQTSVI